MIPVQLTCESEPIASADGPSGGGHRPLIRLNGEPIWRGRPEPTPEDAERVALAYLRYSLGGGGALGADAAGAGAAGFAPPPTGEGEPADTSAAAFLSEAVDALGAEMVDALKRVNAFIESGEWKRFLR
jgi:hypothetical protein